MATPCQLSTLHPLHHPRDLCSDQGPRPRAVGMLRALSALAMSLSDVAPYREASAAGSPGPWCCQRQESTPCSRCRSRDWPAEPRIDLLHCNDLARDVHRPKAILIAGPTASGKSALALALAVRAGGVVINADAMQVYRDLRIITARPTPAEEARVPHRLFGHVDAAESYSVGGWLADARDALAEAVALGRLPILVGGTGLYFKLLTGGLAAIPSIPAEIRERLRARVGAEGAPALHAELARRDPPSAARLDPGDRTRIVRALEVLEATGRSLAEWQQGDTPPILEPAACIKAFLAPERAGLRRRIEARFDVMLAAGALEEVHALAARNLDPLMPAMKAHGVPWLMAHLRGEIGLEEAAAQAKADTRRYAKRQFTWFRNQLPDWKWVEPAAAQRSFPGRPHAPGTCD